MSHIWDLFTGNAIATTRKLSDLQRQADLLRARDDVARTLPSADLTQQVAQVSIIRSVASVEKKLPPTYSLIRGH